MAYYCGECAVWAGSNDVNSYGERWCPFSRKYEKSNQNTYGCRGFVYTGRTVMTAVCNVLDLPANRLFATWDQVKENYLAPLHMDKLATYSSYGPKLAVRLQSSPECKKIAGHMMQAFILPAKREADAGRYEQTVAIYQRMLAWLEGQV